MCGNEILQYVQTFTEVRLDRKFDGLTGRIRHKSTHTGQLLDLLIGTTGSGISHHVNVIVTVQTVQKCICQVGIRFLPNLDNGSVTLLIGQEAHIEVLRDLIHNLLCLFQDILLVGRHGHVRNGYGDTAQRRILVSDGLYIIQHFCRLGSTMDIDTLVQDLLQPLLTYMEVYLRLKDRLHVGTIHKSQILGDHLIEEQLAQSGRHHTGHGLSVRRCGCSLYIDLLLKRDLLVLISEDRTVQALILPTHHIMDRTYDVLEIGDTALLGLFLDDLDPDLIGKLYGAGFGILNDRFHIFMLIFQGIGLYDLILRIGNLTIAVIGQIIDTKYHILRRNGYYTTVRRLQQVVR